MKNALLIFTVLLPKYVFVANAPAPGNSATSHEVLATTVTAVLKQTADFNTSNKLLKVSLCVQTAGGSIGSERDTCRACGCLHRDFPLDDSFLAFFFHLDSELLEVFRTRLRFSLFSFSIPGSSLTSWPSPRPSSSKRKTA